MPLHFFRTRRVLSSTLLLAIASASLSAAVQSPQPMLAAGSLPDAPVAQQQPAPTEAQPPQGIEEKLDSIGKVKIGPRFDPKSVDRSQAGQRLSAKDKILLSFDEQTTVYAFTTEILAAGWEQLINGHPKYGTDSAGFGERLGAAAIRQSSQAVFSDGLFAAAFHQDPRFYRLASGSIKHRIFYAASQTWRTRMDSGAPAINFSLLAGYGAASALTMTYYPAVSATAGRAATGFGWSLMGNMLGNQYHEFWPDIRRNLFHRKDHRP